MRGGKLRERVVFEKEVQTPDGGGGYELSWAPLKETRGQLMLERGRERVEAGRIESAVAGVLRVRWQPGLNELSADDRAVIDGVAYNIRSVTQPDRRNRALEIVLERGVAV